MLLIFFEIEVEGKLTIGEPTLGVSFHHIVYVIRNDALLPILIPCGFQAMSLVLLEGNRHALLTRRIPFGGRSLPQPVPVEGG